LRAVSLEPVLPIGLGFHGEDCSAHVSLCDA
jgi:hypothetical protein